jgi:hypothetical protein
MEEFKDISVILDRIGKILSDKEDLLGLNRVQQQELKESEEILEKQVNMLEKVITILESNVDDKTKYKILLDYSDFYTFFK